MGNEPINHRLLRIFPPLSSNPHHLWQLIYLSKWHRSSVIYVNRRYCTYLFVVLASWFFLHLFLSVFFKSELKFGQIELDLLLELFDILVSYNLLFFIIVWERNPFCCTLTLYIPCPWHYVIRSRIIMNNLSLGLDEQRCEGWLIHDTLKGLSAHKALLGTLFVQSSHPFLLGVLFELLLNW